MRRTLSLVMIYLLEAGCGLGGSQNRRDGWSEARISQMPEELRQGYDVFASRCSRCHTLSRPLGAGITDPEHWRRYVRRMRRMPGAAISDEDAQHVLTFLEAHAGWVRSSREDKGALPAWWDGPSVGGAQ
ncbi:MAG: c-type cytochrome [Myxococcota bacterium]